jgi:hypothetical protein
MLQAAGVSAAWISGTYGDWAEIHPAWNITIAVHASPGGTH